MKRLIDAEKLKSDIKQRDTNPFHRWPTISILDVVERQPTEHSIEWLDVGAEEPPKGEVLLVKRQPKSNDSEFSDVWWVTVGRYKSDIWEVLEPGGSMRTNDVVKWARIPVGGLVD